MASRRLTGFSLFMGAHSPQNEGEERTRGRSETITCQAVPWAESSCSAWTSNAYQDTSLQRHILRKNYRTFAHGGVPVLSEPLAHARHAMRLPIRPRSDARLPAKRPGEVLERLKAAPLGDLLDGEGRLPQELLGAFHLHPQDLVFGRPPEGLLEALHPAAAGQGDCRCQLGHLKSPAGLLADDPASASATSGSLTIRMSVDRRDTTPSG